MNQYTIHQILSYLQKGVVFATVTTPITLIRLKGELVICVQDQWHSKLSWNDFTTLYEDQLFHIYDDVSQEVDFDKDQEFYTWKQ
jgi:hypothetical protein